MIKSRFALALILSLSAMTGTMCCKRTRTTADPKTELAGANAVTTGITGRVEVWEGNFMPLIAPERRQNQIKPAVARRVRVYQPVHIEGGLADAKRDTIPTPLVAETVTDSSGHFAVSVASGTYSIFAEENGGWYNNGWSEKGIQGEVTVTEGKTTDVVIKITTKATF